MSLFTRGQLPKKKLNARGNTELRGINGGIAYDADALLHSFAETDAGYRHGTNGAYLTSPSTPKRMVADSGELRTEDFSEVAEKPTIKVSRANKALVELVSGQISGDLDVSQRNALRIFMSSPQRRVMAEELLTLRNVKSPLSRAQAMRKRTLEMEAGKMLTDLSRMLRSV